MQYDRHEHSSVSRQASMRCSCAVMSPRVTLPIEDEGADVDGAEQEGGPTEFDCRDLNYTSLRLTVA